MWQGEILKAITFPVTVTRDAPAIYESLTGASPENSTRRGLPLPLLSTASGLWRDLQLTVLVQSSRIEANITAVDPNPGTPVPIPPIPSENLEQALATIRDAAGALCFDAPMQRIGAAAQFVRPAESYERGIAFLNKEIDDLFPPAATDALYQLNIRKPLTSNVGEMNRLCKWGVATVGALGITIDQGGNVSRVPMGDDAPIFSFLHLDINNVPFTEPTPQAITRSVTDELWSEVERLHAGGFNVLA